MKKLNMFILGFTYAGCFLGAGYVSGQELWQFFGAYGVKGIYGLIITVLIQFAFGIILVQLVHKTEIYEMDRIAVKWDIPVLRGVFSAGATFFMFGIFIIMSAGTGALLNRIFGLSEFIGCGIFCLIIAFMAFKGIDGMVSVFSWFVPALVIGAVVISVVSVGKAGLGAIVFKEADGRNLLLGNWFFASITYVSYNLFGSIGIIAPLGKRVQKKTVIPGILFGCVLLFSIALGILFAMVSHGFVIGTELPMLELACNLSMVVGYVYAVMLFFGMFGTSLSSFVAVIIFGEQKWEWFAKKRNFIIVFLSIVAWICSFAGFSDLIGLVYPISGYFGFIVIIGVIVHYIVSIKCEKKRIKYEENNIENSEVEIK